MKKGLLMMASAFVGLSAIAAPKVAQQQSSELMKMSGTDITFSQSPNLNKKAALKPGSVSDMLGFYSVPFGQWMFDSADPYDGESHCVFKAGDSASEILIYGMFNYQPFPITMTVDFAKGEATIREQMLGYAAAADANMKIQVMQANMEAQKWENAQQIVGVITDDGTIDFGESCIMLMNADKEGYGWGGFGSFLIVPADYYNVDLSEWNKAGTCDFKDGWIAPLYSEDIPAQELVVYENKTEKGVYAFQNPYAGEIWREINTPPAGKTKEGWIVVDASNDECVCAHTLVASGLWLQMAEDGSNLQQFFMYNVEGYKYYVSDISPDEQADEYYGIGKDPRDFLSYKEGNVITLRNLIFGETDNPLGMYEWVNNEGTSAMTLNTVFTLHLEGVNEIEFDANAPVKYFNLQGMEVVNPAQGQMVIKTQGNKAQKVVF